MFQCSGLEGLKSFPSHIFWGRLSVDQEFHPLQEEQVLPLAHSLHSTHEADICTNRHLEWVLLTSHSTTHLGAMRAK